MYALLLAVLLSSFQLDTPQIEAEAHSLVGDVARASGNVVATWPGFRLETGALEWNRVTHLLTVPGPVTLTRGEERLTGSRLEMRTDTLEGTIYEVDGFIGPGLRVVAEEAERLADGRYIVRRGTLILCDDNGAPVLEHQVLSDTEVNPGVSLTSSGNVLRFRGIPIAYLPYFRMSLEDQGRSSGFLFPQTSTSTTKGRSVSLSWHQVLGRSADMTLRAEYFTRRGMGGGVQFRAVPGPGSRIEVNNFFVDDRLGQGGQRTQIAASTDGERLRTVADLNIFSSFEFRQVFEENFNVISSPTERSVAFGTYNGDGVTYNAAYHRQGTFFRDQQTAITRKFPGLDMLVHTRPLGSTGLYLSLEAGVAALHRRDALVSSAPLVGKFDLAPRLEIPVLRGAALGWSHSVGLRETLYTHRAAPGSAGPDLLNRLVFDYGFELSGPNFERPLGGWTHVVGPEVAYRYRVGIDDFDDTLRVDEADLLTNTHEVRYGITNRLFGEGGQLLSWSVAQKYFLDPGFGGALEEGRDNVLDPFLDLTGFGFADRSRRFSPVVSVLRFAPVPSRAVDLQIDYDTTTREFRSTGLIGRYRAGLTYYNVAYFRTSETPIQIDSDQVRATVGYGDTERVGFNGSLNFSYNVDESILQTTTARLSYNTECYGLHLEFSQFDVGSRKESRFRFAFSLTDLGSIGTLRRSDQFF